MTTTAPSLRAGAAPAAAAPGEPRVRELLSAVPFAWPTVVLAAGCAAAFGLAAWAGLSGRVAWPLASALASLAAFAAFTPMHDASHRAITRGGLLEELVGRVMALLVLSPFPAFRFVHLEHHKHVNEEETDPDLWSGKGPVWLLPVRWVTQDLYYYVWYLRRASRRPSRELAEIALTLVAAAALLVTLAALGHGEAVLWLWLVPSRLAVGALAATFDWLPHHPHRVTAAENRFVATSILEHRWLTPLLFGQNYHLVHHLYPAVPFYRYGRVWWALRDKLVRQGARVRRLG